MTPTGIPHVTDRSSARARRRQGRLPALAALAAGCLCAGCGTAAHHLARPDSDPLAAYQLARSGPDPLAALPLYTQRSGAATSAEQHLHARGELADARLLQRITSEPQAIWLGNWDGPHIARTVAGILATAKAQHAMPVLVLYNIPGRDRGGYSSGGTSSASDYRAWVDQVASALGTWPSAVIVEPDALAELDRRTRDQQTTTIALIHYAVNVLAPTPRTAVYIDAGTSAWHPADVMAQRLLAAGVNHARGFALNISNFQTTAAEMAYGDRLSAALAGVHYVIDVSRNGQGPSPDHQWCNPPGRGLGVPPTVHTGNPLVDALLWIKHPGASDGTCNDGPKAGTLSIPYALGLAARAAQG
jgi:endoglucanase